MTSNILRIIAAVVFSTLTAMNSASARTLENRTKAGSDTILKLNNGKPQATLEKIRSEYPFLAEALEAYALGDVWSRQILDDRTRQLAAVSAFAATGELGMLRVHAGYALNIGVREEELKEILYLVTVPAGFPKVIAASQVLSEVIKEHKARSVDVDKNG